jgi:hypothetical protein
MHSPFYNRRVALTLLVRHRPVVRVEPDLVHPQMWRVRLPAGGLCGILNLARAKDAALDLAEAIEARKTPHKSPLKSLIDFEWSSSPIAPNGTARVQRRNDAINAPVPANGGGR